MGLRLDGVESDCTRSDLEAYSRRLVVEVDSWTYHRGSVAFQDDHARDLDLRAAGYVVLRYTEKQLENEPDLITAELRRALGLSLLAV